MPFWWSCATDWSKEGVRISRATMGRIVQKLKLTRKKNFARNWARHSKNTAVKSSTGGNGAVNLADLVFADETGSNLWMTTLCSRERPRL